MDIKNLFIAVFMAGVFAIVGTMAFSKVGAQASRATRSIR